MVSQIQKNTYLLTYLKITLAYIQMAYKKVLKNVETFSLHMIPCVIGISNFSYETLHMAAYLIIRTFFTQTHWQKRPVSKDLFCKLARSSRKAKWKFKFIFATFCHGQIIPYLFWRPSMCWCLFYVSEIEFLLKNEVTKLELVFFIPYETFQWIRSILTFHVN